jgi:glycerol uptake facilitator-like aquaporin
MGTAAAPGRSSGERLLLCVFPFKFDDSFRFPWMRRIVGECVGSVRLECLL